MSSKIRVFDHFMKPLDIEVKAPTTPRSWILNGYGRCEFSIGFDITLPQSAQLCQEKYFQFGNLVHIEHLPTQDQDGNINGKLPDWVGIILPPRNWDNGILRVTAFSAEAILAFRAMPFVKVQGTPKTVFTAILDHVHARTNNIIFQPGILDDLSLTFPDDLRTNAYDHINKLVKDSGMDWSITSQIDEKGNLQLFANLYLRKGIKTNLTLSNINTELQSPLLTEQGTPSNQVFGYSQEQTAQKRSLVEAINQNAMNDYGPLQLNQVFIGKHDSTSTLNSAQTSANERGRPKKLFKRIALDRGNTFDNLDTGNIVDVKENNAGFNPNGGFGFESQVRILSIDYNDLSNKAPLNIEII